MAPETPRARVLPVLIMLTLVAAQVVLRYRFGFLHDSKWQGVHIVVGFSLVLAVFTAFHGVGALRRVRGETWALLVFGVVAFLAFWSYGRMDTYNRVLRQYIPPQGPFGPVFAFIYFSLGSFFFRLVLPLAFAWWIFKRSPAALGLFAPRNPHPPAVRRIWPVYLALYLGVLPFVIGVAQTAAFQAKYPMSRAMIGPDHVILVHQFLLYEAFYFLIFVAGESFWRGYLAFGMERDFGAYALPLMVVPYVTAHFGKPLPETLGAILAGMTLGWLALKHRSVWLGVALHYGVALSMDLLAIHANGFILKL